MNKTTEIEIYTMFTFIFKPQTQTKKENIIILINKEILIHMIKIHKQ